jgi:diguanylate cyclase (GGDEF)-like protein
MPRRRARPAPAPPLDLLTELLQEFGALDLERICEAAIRRIPPLVKASRASLYLYDYEADELTLAGQDPGRRLPERLPMKAHRHTLLDRVVTTRRCVVVDGFSAFAKAHGLPLERPFSSTYATETCLVAPLVTGTYLVGVLSLADREGGSFDAEHEVPLVEHLGRILAMAIRNGRLFKEVQAQAHTDALTGLRNYRAFHEALRTELHRAQRYRRPLGLVTLDIDAFKELNDRHGHPAGDAALSQLGKVIRAAVRREDIAARIGGDEVAVILPETDEKGCRSVVERLMTAARAHKFTFQDRKLAVTISVGHAGFRPGQSVVELMKEADAALYKAKRSGKNRAAAAE